MIKQQGKVLKVANTFASVCTTTKKKPKHVLCVCSSITPAEMAPFTEQLLNNLFKALALPGSAENEYIMKGKPVFVSSSDAPHQVLIIADQL